MDIPKLTSHNLKGFLTILLIPVILFFIFYLPSDVKEMLILHRDYSNFYDLLTTHFVHEDLTNHLLPNVLIYLGAALLLYIFLSILNERKLFYTLFVTNCLIVPFIISLLWIPVNRLIWTRGLRSFGFSGIVSAFLGTLVFAYVLFLHRTLKVDISYAYLSSISFTALVFVLIYFTFTESFIITAASLLLFFVMFAYKTIKSIDKKAEMKLQEKLKNTQIAYIIVSILYLLILIFSLNLFPRQFIQENTTVNFLIHYVGFIIGIGVAQLIWQHSHGTILNSKTLQY